MASPIFAYAGVFSFVTDLFSKDKAPVVESLGTSNSQKMPLLEAATNIDPNPTKIQLDTPIVNGNSLLTSAGPQGTAVEVSKEKAYSDKITIYSVHEGDTVASVAKMFNVTSNTILWANDLKAGAKLKTDQILIILPVSGIRHTVVKGETLKSIATSYKGDVDEIIQFNNLADNAKIVPGDVLTIPDGEAPNLVVTKKPSTGGSSGGSLLDTSGYFARPVSGGRRTQGLHGHNGIDIAGALGSNIYAAADGTVIISKSSGWNGGYGNYVVISHANGTQTLYAHLNDVDINVGDVVSKGQVIGFMGNSGKSTGVHLHFEVRGGKNPF